MPPVSKPRDPREQTSASPGTNLGMGPKPREQTSRSTDAKRGGAAHLVDPLDKEKEIDGGRAAKQPAGRPPDGAARASSEKAQNRPLSRPRRPRRRLGSRRSPPRPHGRWPRLLPTEETPSLGFRRVDAERGECRAARSRASQLRQTPSGSRSQPPWGRGRRAHPRSRPHHRPRSGEGQSLRLSTSARRSQAPLPARRLGRLDAGTRVAPRLRRRIASSRADGAPTRRARLRLQACGRASSFYAAMRATRRSPSAASMRSGARRRPLSFAHSRRPRQRRVSRLLHGWGRLSSEPSAPT